MTAKSEGTQAMKTLARIGIMALALCASPHPGALYAIADALPQGPIVGDQDLSPFYRWTGALPKKPGLVLREEGIPDQPEIVAAATAEENPVHFDGRKMAIRHHSGKRHALSSEGSRATGRMAACCLGARHARRRRQVRAILEQAPAARRRVYQQLAGTRFCRRCD